MVWHAYADDSGTHDNSEYCLLLGYIGSPAQWKRVRRDWRRVLGDIPEFKSTEFFQRERWQSSKSPYHNWNDERARKFLNDLLTIIDRCAIWPIGGACKTTDFWDYPKETCTWLTGANLLTNTHWYDGQLEIKEKLVEHEGSPERPYFIVFPGLLVDAMQYTSGKRSPKIHFYLDRQGDAEAKALQAFNQLKERITEPERDNLASVNYRESVDEVGIQAADLYAHTWYRYLTNRMTPDSKRAYRVLSKKKPTIRIADKETYFSPLLAYGNESRQDAVRKRIAELSG